MKTILLSVLIAVVSYLLGSISPGLIIAGVKGINLREKGSGNTGASNAMRVMGIGFGLLTYAGDFLKASLSIIFALLLLPGATFGIPKYSVLLSSLFVVIGHNWPIYYHFQGGKGVTCTSAVILFLNPVIGVVSIAVFFLVLLISKYISLSSMCMILCNLLLTIIFCSSESYTIAIAAVLMLFSVLRHHGNIRRIINGTERKIGQKEE